MTDDEDVVILQNWDELRSTMELCGIVPPLNVCNDTLHRIEMLNVKSMNTTKITASVKT